MPNLKLTAVSSIGALSSLLFACTGVMSGNPGGDGATPGGPGTLPSGGSGGTTMVGTAGTTSTASSKPEVGVMTIRRLNRTQYTNTLGALTGTKTDPGSKFPADDLSFGFDNIGEALTVQPLHIELFEQSADAVLAELFSLPATDANRSKVLALSLIHI